MRFELLTFSLLMWAAQFSPGPDMLLLMKNSVGHSRVAALGTVAGIVCGLAVWSALILSGLAVVLRESPQAFALLRTIGGFYLAWLGGRLLWSLRRPAGTAGQPGTGAGSLGFRGGFAQGLTTNLLNAKAAMFLIGSLAAFHPPASPAWLKWALGAIVLGQAAIGWSAFVCLLGWRPVRTWFLRHQRPWNALFGVLLIAAGVAAVGSTR
ncbi:MAG: LysE family translocator [Verrucomicrobiales bacterium]